MGQEPLHGCLDEYNPQHSVYTERKGKRMQQMKNKKWTFFPMLLLCLFMSFSTVCGFSLSISNEVEILYSSNALAVIVAIGLTVSSFSVILLLDQKRIQRNGRVQAIIRAEINKRVFLLAAITLFLSYLIYILADFPGSLPYDTHRQLQQFFG